MGLRTALASRQRPIVNALGPAVVLYGVAAAAPSVQWNATSFAIAGVLVFASMAGALAATRAPRPDAWRLNTIASSMSVACLPLLRSSAPPWWLPLSSYAALALCAGLLLEAALVLPDSPPRIRRLAWWRSVIAGGTAVLALPMVLVAVDSRSRNLVALDTWAWQLGITALLACGWFGLALRSMRSRMGSEAVALAFNGYALCGLAVGVGAWTALEAFAGWTRIDRSVWWFCLGGVAAASTITLGHAAMVSRWRGVRAPRSVRRLVALALSVAATCAIASLIADRVQLSSATAVVFALTIIATFSMAHAFFVPRIERRLAPFGGRLRSGTNQARRSLERAESYEDMLRAVLQPLRAASDDPAGEPLVFSADPATRGYLDSAGEPRFEPSPIPEAVLQYIMSNAGLVSRETLEEQVVRRAELRPLLDVLEQYHALCIVPLRINGEAEGALLVPRGRRSRPLDVEEAWKLEDLGAHLATHLAIWSARARAEQREADARHGHSLALDRIEALDARVARFALEAQALKSQRASDDSGRPPIAYSAAMRTLLRRLEDVAALDAPVYFHAEPGSDLQPVARWMHRFSGRQHGAFLVVDCAALDARQHGVALFGGHGADRLGWLRLADEGTLLLENVAALDLDAQARLSDALATKQARTADGLETYSIDVRLLAGSPVPLSDLVTRDALHASLAQRLSPLCFTIPPLRQRVEDIASLVLLVIDETSRARGADPCGIEPRALQMLTVHAWPGNHQELQLVVQRALEHAQPPLISHVDVAYALGTESPGPTTESQAWNDTYFALERRILLNAIERARGNKSEAARMLGLARSTFIDKLRRHGLDLDTPNESAG
jgi:DNA-binding NtrC family response regulator